MSNQQSPEPETRGSHSSPPPGSGLGGFTLLRGRLKDGQCAECAVVHDPSHPHNQQSLFWQYSFMEKQGRWPTWADAMAHCTPQMQADWTRALAEHGIIVPNAKLTDRANNPRLYEREN
jgi:hypothetical protein